MVAFGGDDAAQQRQTDVDCQQYRCYFLTCPTPRDVTASPTRCVRPSQRRRHSRTTLLRRRRRDTRRDATRRSSVTASSSSWASDAIVVGCRLLRSQRQSVRSACRSRLITQSVSSAAAAAAAAPWRRLTSRHDADRQRTRERKRKMRASNDSISAAPDRLHQTGVDVHLGAGLLPDDVRIRRSRALCPSRTHPVCCCC